jgi:predicted Fe-Mo cluster-binding NifX family protein
LILTAPEVGKPDSHSSFQAIRFPHVHYSSNFDDVEARLQALLKEGSFRGAGFPPTALVILIRVSASGVITACIALETLKVTGVAVITNAQTSVEDVVQEFSHIGLSFYKSLKESSSEKIIIQLSKTGFFQGWRCLSRLGCSQDISYSKGRLLHNFCCGRRDMP